ncbi:class I SAM-dependent methyltransferase [bacterium]|nr:class I SAM-dependent methyltransferase [bacterium]
MQRFDLINRLIETRSYKSYLEIGLRNPQDCFDHIRCDHKHSVDPGYDYVTNLATYPYTSDEFFKLLNEGNLDLPADFDWDLIFIDGLHLAEQAYRDFLNSTTHLSTRGAIVFHDTNPPYLDFAREDPHNFSTSAGSDWNGTIWKVIQQIRTQPRGLDGRDYSVLTVDTDWGVSVCWANPPESLLSERVNSFFEFNKFSEHRDLILNLRSVSEFEEWLTIFSQ